MTRDEAIEIKMRSHKICAGFDEHGYWDEGQVRLIVEAEVDELVAFGILKLAAPLEPHEVLAKELGWGTVNTDILKNALACAGLKVVQA